MNIYQSFENEMKRYEQILDLPWNEKNFYMNWLAQSYYYICQSTRILTLAAAHFGIAQDKHHQRFVQHTREEKGHEKLVYADLQKMGYNISNFSQGSEVTAFYATQFYKIQHVNPISVYGWILSLEGLAITHGKAIHDKVQSSAADLPTKFIALHVEEDVSHMEKALAMVTDLDPDSLKLIEENMILSTDLYMAFTNSCLSKNYYFGKDLAA
ncbi:MAG: iron-containing redox enzyme family protein [Bdellovibrionales bacterium]|nr:iron-containing redox enzyme family protein [Bdellovibrionales bacterium]